MPRESMTAGNLKIQQKHTRQGKPLCFVPIPMAAMEVLGWQPGQWLTYYPTKGRELVLVSQGQALLHVSPDYDLSTQPEPKPLLGVRPGSVEARRIEVETELEGMMAARLNRRKEAMAAAAASPRRRLADRSAGRPSGRRSKR